MINTLHYVILLINRQLVELIFAKTSSIDLSSPDKDWSFLDGYRGSLALIVIIFHSSLHTNCEIINLTIGYSQSYSIAGFFMLSAFLLTYRLLIEFDKASTLSQYLIITLKYFIRRFCRIYLFYILFYTAAKYGPVWIGGTTSNGHITTFYKAPLFHIATLGNTGVNHLWTIPSELKYYFVIPLFSFLATRLRPRYATVFLGTCLLWSILDVNVNFFKLTEKDSMPQNQNTHELRSHFAVFFQGSQVALSYFLIEKNAFLMNSCKFRLVNVLLDVSSLVCALVGLRCNMFVWYDDFSFKTRATFYWSIALLLTLLAHPNSFISMLFAHSRYLRRIGKYSFSFYVLHFGTIYVVRNTIRFATQFEHIVVCVVFTYLVSLVSFYASEDGLIWLAKFLCAKIDAFTDCFKEKSIGNDFRICLKPVWDDGSN
jgi:peptidoglycan/LPS O-acetylase OafA/YrhL